MGQEVFLGPKKSGIYTRIKGEEIEGRERSGRQRKKKVIDYCCDRRWIGEEKRYLITRRRKGEYKNALKKSVRWREEEQRPRCQAG